MEQDPRLLVYKASAGSGKTFTLAVQYIRQLIEDPYSYRRILAVTFTNKATTEGYYRDEGKNPQSAVRYRYFAEIVGRLSERDNEDLK